MSFYITDKGLSEKLARYLERSQRQNADSLEKLSSGQVFTANDPRPADRALVEGMEFKLRGLASAKRNINDAVSLLQTADGAMNEINNIITRLKEINIAATNATVSDQERRFLFVEYQALYDEVDRIAKTTEFNGLPLLNGESDLAPDALVFHIGDPEFNESLGEEEDLNTIRFDGLKSVISTPRALGLKSAYELLGSTSDETGFKLSEAEDMLAPSEPESFATSYDQALASLATQRAVYGSLQTRLFRAKDYVDVYEENIAAAKSKIADTDYAAEVARLTQSTILTQATTAVLSASNINAQLCLSLIQSVLA